MENVYLLSILFLSCLLIFIICNCKKQKQNMSDSPPFLIDIVYTWVEKIWTKITQEKRLVMN